MFDTVKCEYPLPLPEDLGECSEILWSEFEFKTATFDGALDDIWVEGPAEILYTGAFRLELISK